MASCLEAFWQLITATSHKYDVLRACHRQNKMFPNGNHFSLPPEGLVTAFTSVAARSRGFHWNASLAAFDFQIRDSL